MNPAVAVVVGYFLGGESIGLRTIFGTLLVLVSVVILTTSPGKKARVESKAQETQAYAEAVPDE